MTRTHFFSFVSLISELHRTGSFVSIVGEESSIDFVLGLLNRNSADTVVVQFTLHRLRFRHIEEIFYCGEKSRSSSESHDADLPIDELVYCC